MRALLGLAALLAACGATADPGPSESPTFPPSATSSATPAAPGSPSPTPSTDAVLLIAGDIGNCDLTAPSAVAALGAAQPGVIAVAGDVAARDGSAEDYARCVEPAWGSVKARMRPAPGNHDYGTGNAEAYFDYFGDAAGPRGEGWYSYNLGPWHIVALNSNCALIEGGCGTDSPEYVWLKANLAANPRPCTLAYWHHPRFTSGLHGSNASMSPIWTLLETSGVDVVVNGHDQHYERFAPLDADGGIDPAGIRLFIAGTGGADLFPVLSAAPGSEVRNVASHGLLRFDLEATGYSWQFLAADGPAFTDSGHGSCH